MSRSLLLPLLPALLLTAAVGAACASNPNEDVESNEFIRPSAANLEEESSDRAEPEAEDQAQRNEPSDPAPREDTPAPAEEGEEDLDLAEDIVRRYLNDIYGYSLELVCGAFCDATSTGVDRVGFLSDDGRALINVTVRPGVGDAPDFAALEDLWREATNVPDAAEIVEREETVLAADGVSPALHLRWQADRRDQGGFLERWHSLITQVGPIAYFINAGAIEETFDEVEPTLLQSLDTFLPRREPPSVPGRFQRWEFLLPYDPTGITGQLGNVTPEPSFDSGIFVQQSAEGTLELIVFWESVSEALFDPDQSITEALTEGLSATEEGPRQNVTVAGDIPARLSIASANVGQQESTVATYAWYCADGGRSFLLQSFSPDDPQGEVADTLQDFRCLTTAE